jgi:deoxyadenosine/deoxycytidine kinase
MGVGKRALAARLAERLSAQLVLQPRDNPFVSMLYSEDRGRFALQAQLSFLLSRFAQQGALAQGDLFARGRVITDYLFARDRIYAGLTLTPEELTLYERVAGLLVSRVSRPDLVIYLQARPEVLLGRIRKRALPHERRMVLEDLEEVARAYHGFFFHWAISPLLVVDTSEIDVAADPAELERLLAIIGRHRGGVQHYIPTLGSAR